MRPSLRFLVLAIFGWAGARAATLGTLPGAELFSIKPSEARVPPVVATQFPPIDSDMPEAEYLPVATAAVGPMIEGYPTTPRVVAVPVYYGMASSPRADAGANMLPAPRRQFYAPAAFEEWPLSRLAAMSSVPARSASAPARQSTPIEALKSDRIDRLQLSAWALLRPPSRTGAPGQSLAAAGSLGASQAGARLSYNVTRQLAVTFRTSSEVGRRGGEIAAAVRAQPLSGIPVWINAERRQRIGRYGGGRSAFALFAEGGVYERPMPLRFLLDGYLQAGIVGTRSRDWFVDGSAVVTRPVYKQFSAGLGVWGGAQPGLARLDAGPRITMRVRPNLKVHADWRQHIAGNAEPGSGPALTLAGDF